MTDAQWIIEDKVAHLSAHGHITLRDIRLAGDILQKHQEDKLLYIICDISQMKSSPLNLRKIARNFRGHRSSMPEVKGIIVYGASRMSQFITKILTEKWNYSVEIVETYDDAITHLQSTGIIVDGNTNYLVK